MPNGEQQRRSLHQFLLNVVMSVKKFTPCTAKAIYQQGFRPPFCLLGSCFQLYAFSAFSLMHISFQFDLEKKQLYLEYKSRKDTHSWQRRCSKTCQFS